MEMRIGSVPDHTEDAHMYRSAQTYTYSVLTVERWSCENINFIIQGPLVEA